ncbi:DnaA regulatory inactivator Hda [Spongiibacter marinus]|uniref:DnaA regulatory inactivator Hda n=1 Tax=Spongiibacter marinus TaxID=354246 RepID=UPI003C5BD754
MASTQLPLALSLDTEATFDNYYVAPSQQLPVAVLKGVATGQGEQLVYLAGRSGRRHLLQACCQLADAQGRSVRYIPAAELLDYPAEMVLEDADLADLVCIDGLSAIAGRSGWEVALFSLYNRALGGGCSLLFASTDVPDQLAIELPDLASRLQSFSVYRLSELSEDERIAALCHRAQIMGLDINEALAEFIYRRCQRDLKALFDVLNELDRHSLARQRRLTIPFVKEIMSW